MTDTLVSGDGDRVLLAGASVRISELRWIHLDPGITAKRENARPFLTIALQGAQLHHAYRETSLSAAASAVAYQDDALFRLRMTFRLNGSGIIAHGSHFRGAG